MGRVFSCVLGAVWYAAASSGLLGVDCGIDTTAVGYGHREPSELSGTPKVDCRASGWQRRRVGDVGWKQSGRAFPGDSGRVGPFSEPCHSRVTPSLRVWFRTGALFASFSPDPGMLQDPVFYGISPVHENFLVASAQNFLAASAHGLSWLTGGPGSGPQHFGIFRPSEMKCDFPLRVCCRVGSILPSIMRGR